MSDRACTIGKDYVPASFKGVQFWCVEADVEVGRRGAEGEFPFGEKTAYADLGRKIRTYRLKAVFRRDDHVADSGALMAACESIGPGTLVHPTRGTQLVACRTCKIQDQLEESAGETTADLEFVEANLPGGFSTSLWGVIPSDLNTQAQVVFLRDYQPALASQPWTTDVIDRTQELVNALYQMTVRTMPADAPNPVRRNAIKMGEIAKDNGLAAVAVYVDKAFVSGFQAVAKNIADPVAEFKAMRQLTNVAVKTPDVPDGYARDSMEAAMSRYRILGAVAMAEAAMARQYVHTDECLMAMDIVVRVLEHEAQLAYDNCDNLLFLEIRKYSTEFQKMMYDLAYRLPGLVVVNFMGGVHPLVAAYAMYNDATRHRELEQRNIVDANGRFQPLVVGLTPQ
jgi:hypothetical protein